MSVLSQLNPAPIWIYFEEICKIPRISKNEEKIRQYLLDFAKRNNLESKEDNAGNILIIRQASLGMRTKNQLFCKVIWIWLEKKMPIIRITGKQIL